MKQSALALLLGSASATITKSFGCNFDVAKSGGSDAVVVTWTDLTLSGWTDTSTAADCETKGKAAVDAVTTKTGLEFCAEFRKDGGGAGKNTCVAKSVKTTDLSAKSSELNVKLAVDAKPTYTEDVQAVNWDASATVKVPTSTNNDNTKAGKMKMEMGLNTPTGVTWATAVAGIRETGKTRIQSAPACGAWCTATAKADTAMNTKVGVCEFVQTAATAGELGTCNWHTTTNKDKVTKDALPVKAVPATATKITFSAFYLGDSTALDAYPTATTTTTTTTDTKKEDSASSLVAGAAGLMAAALMY